MALATKPKRTSISHKRRSGTHHHHNKPYLKHYWPYLPMLMIVGIGAVIDRLWPVGSTVASQPFGSQFASTVQPGSRLEMLTGSHATWLFSVVACLSIIAFTVFLVRHSHRLHRLLVKGESFASNHPLLDIALVFVFTAGFILTSSNGLIG
ncbi:MAG: hypothetical protein WA843_04280 [Candidatus Saccharimonadales bacterium]